MSEIFEYDMQVSFNEAMNEEALLAERGLEGWKLCAVLQCADCMTKHYFIRVKDVSQDEAYQKFVEEMSVHCQCKESNRPCDGVLAGGICDDIKDEPDDREDN